MATGAHSGSSELSLSSLARRVLADLRSNLTRTLVVAIIGFLVGWAANVYVIAVRYEGSAYPAGGIGTVGSTLDMLRSGGAYWGVLSTVVFSLAAFGHRAGWRRLAGEIVSLPRLLRDAVGQGAASWALLLWGAALSLLIAATVGPAAAGVLGLGLLLAAPSPLAGILGSAAGRLWVTVLRALAPTRGVAAPGGGGMVATTAGTAAGMILAWQVSSMSVKVVLAVAAAAGSYVLVTRRAAPPAVAAMLAVLTGGLLLRDILGAAAFADDGGWTECIDCTIIDWIGSEGAGAVIASAARGGVAAGAGAAVGSALGGAVADLPPVSPDDEVPPMPTELPPFPADEEAEEEELEEEELEEAEEELEEEELEEEEEEEEEEPEEAEEEIAARRDATLHRDVEEFLAGHPEYERIRDRLLDPDGTVNEAAVDAMMEHYERFGPGSAYAEQAAREQEALSRFADDFFDDHPDYDRFADRVRLPDGTLDRDLLRRLVEHNRLYGDREPAESDMAWIAEGLAGTMREIFTGQDENGDTSYRSLVLRGLMGVATGGASEWVYTPGDSLYRIKDGIDRGEEGPALYGRAAAGAILDEMIGRALGAGFEAGADALARRFPTLARDLGDLADDLATRLNRPLGGTTPLTPELADFNRQLREALDSGDDEALRAVYGNGGMERLGQLEAGGHLSPEDARRLVGFHDRVSSQAVDQGTRDAIEQFRHQHGFAPNEVMVGNSGSTGPFRSVQTDADRTIVATFSDDAVRSHARTTGMSEADAALDLQRRFTDIHQGSVDRALTPPGSTPLSAQDMDVKSYSGFGSGAGPPDSYPAGYTRARQSIQGSADVYRVDADGSIRSHPASGQAIIDQNALNAQRYGGTPVGDPTRIPDTELGPLLDQQRNSVAGHGDVKSIAKAVDRAGYVAGRAGQPLPDPNLTSAAGQIRSRPQDVQQILRDHGLTEEQFVAGSKGMMDAYQPQLP